LEKGSSLRNPRFATPTLALGIFSRFNLLASMLQIDRIKQANALRAVSRIDKLT